MCFQCRRNLQRPRCHRPRLWLASATRQRRIRDVASTEHPTHPTNSHSIATIASSGSHSYRAPHSIQPPYINDSATCGFWPVGANAAITSCARRAAVESAANFAAYHFPVAITISSDCRSTCSATPVPQCSANPDPIGRNDGLCPGCTRSHSNTRGDLYNICGWLS
jgi:hypothetical protein